MLTSSQQTRDLSFLSCWVEKRMPHSIKQPSLRNGVAWFGPTCQVWKFWARKRVSKLAQKWRNL